jgi:translocation and assembly module TamA
VHGLAAFVLAGCLWLLIPAAAAEVVLRVEPAPEPAVDGLRRQLRDRLGLAEEPCDAPQWRVRRLYERIDDDLVPGLHAFGFYAASVTKELSRDDDCWRATVTVDPGPRTRVRDRRIAIAGEAADDAAFDTLIRDLPLPVGAPLTHAGYETIKSRLRSLAAQRGYLDFRFTRHELRIHPEDAAAEIVIEADSGARYAFGELRFGDHPLSPDLVRRLVPVEAGDALDTASLIGVDRALSDSGYFSRVEVRPARDEAEDGVIPVDVKLEPAPRHAWRAGVGFSTDTQWRLSLGYDNRYLNPAGHRLESEVRVGLVEAGLKVDYLVPGRNPRQENFSLGARLAREEIEDTVSDSAILIGRQVLAMDGWTQTRFVELLHERSEVGDTVSRDTLVMPGIAFERAEIDDVLRVGRGYRLNLEVRGAHDDLFSTTSMLQLRASARGAYRIADAGRINARIGLGATLVDETESLPVSLRFFAGGDNSVRGYGYKSLGPRDDEGLVRGGRYLLTGSLEYEHPVFGDDWWGAAFVDAGTAFDDDPDPKVGYGVGLRWFSPVGRVRLDLAFPADTRDDDWRIHFGLGAAL